MQVSFESGKASMGAALESDNTGTSPQDSEVRSSPPSQSGTEPQPSLEKQQIPPGNIIIAVADDGIGIDAEDLPDIFDRYRQAGQSANRRYKGTGLGLAVVKELAELHGGSVSVESKRKCGSTFTVRIPYVPVDTEEYDEDTAR